MRSLLRACLFPSAVLLACVPALSAPGSKAVSWLPVVDIAAGGGANGPWRQNDSRYDYVDDGTAAFTHGGGLAVAWVDQRRKDVLLQVFTPDGRAGGAPVDVSRSPASFSWMPRIAAGGLVTVPHGEPEAGGHTGSQQGLLGKKLAAGDGMVVLVNSSLAPGRGSRVWLMRGYLPDPP